MTKLLFFFSTTKIGGAETNILKISRELVKRGFEIHFASLVNDGNMLEMVDFPLASYTEIGDYRRYLFASISKYRILIKGKGIDVVSNFGFKVELFSRLLSKQFGAKRIISNIRSTNTDKSYVYFYLDRMTSKNVDRYISNSIAGKNVYHERGKIPLDKIGVIYNFITKKKGNADFIGNGFAYNIGMLANIRSSNKGHFDLIEICQKLVLNGVRPHFYLGGTDFMNGVVQLEIKKNGLEPYFSFDGYVSDKMGFFNKIDLFLLPSYMEGMPTVILEAMSCGIPVIASDVGGIPEQIENGYNGFTCRPGDIDGFVESIKKMENDVLRKKFIHNSYLVLEAKFSKEMIIKEWVMVLKYSGSEEVDN